MQAQARAAGFQHFGTMGLFLSKDSQRVLTAQQALEEHRALEAEDKDEYDDESDGLAVS